MRLRCLRFSPFLYHKLFLPNVWLHCKSLNQISEHSISLILCVSFQTSILLLFHVSGSSVMTTTLLSLHHFVLLSAQEVKNPVYILLCLSKLSCSFTIPAQPPLFETPECQWSKGILLARAQKHCVALVLGVKASVAIFTPAVVVNKILSPICGKERSVTWCTLGSRNSALNALVIKSHWQRGSWGKKSPHHVMFSLCSAALSALEIFKHCRSGQVTDLFFPLWPPLTLLQFTICGASCQKQKKTTQAFHT